MQTSDIPAHLKDQLTRTTGFNGQQRHQIHVTHNLASAADNGIGSLIEFEATHREQLGNL